MRFDKINLIKNKNYAKCCKRLEINLLYILFLVFC